MDQPRPVVEAQAAAIDLPYQRRPPASGHLSLRNMAPPVPQRFCVAGASPALTRPRPELRRWTVLAETAPLIDRKIGFDRRRRQPRYEIGKTARHQLRCPLVKRRKQPLERLSKERPDPRNTFVRSDRQLSPFLRLVIDATLSADKYLPLLRTTARRFSRK